MINLNITPDGNIIANFYVEGTTGGGGGGGTGTVTSVATSGTGLGFSLTGGPITTTGTVALTVPSAGALRTSLAIGNVANANFNGSAGDVLYGNGSWAPAAGGGTVTSVATSGSGLGFALSGGPITGSGTVALTVPTSSALRTSLTIGNVANLNLDGNSANVLYGNGVWAAGATGTGTVTSVATAGSGLGFSLTGGPITGTGTVTLATPTAGDLRTSLTIGNVANLDLNGNAQTFLDGSGSWTNIAVPTGNIANTNLNGNAQTYLDGTGAWANIATVGGSNTHIQFNDDGVPGGSGNLTWNDIQVAIKSNGNPLSLRRYSTSAFPIMNSMAAARGTPDAPANLNVGDSPLLGYYGYTTSGPVAVSGEAGYATLGLQGYRLDAIAANGLANGSAVFYVYNSSSTTAQLALALESDRTANMRANANVAGNLNVTGSIIGATNANITGNLTVGGVINANAIIDLNYATEAVNLIGAQTGTYSFNMNDYSVQYSTANATANITLDLRGNVVTVNSIVPVGGSIVGTYIMTTGSTPYTITAVQVDSVTQTVKWSGGSAPTAQANSTNAYTFTVIKTAATPTWTVLGSMTRYA